LVAGMGRIEKCESYSRRGLGQGRDGSRVGTRKARASPPVASDSASADVPWLRARLGEIGVEILVSGTRDLMEKEYEAPARSRRAPSPRLPFDFRRWRPTDRPAARRDVDDAPDAGAAPDDEDQSQGRVYSTRGAGGSPAGLDICCCAKREIPVRVFPGVSRVVQDPSNPWCES